MGRYAVFDNNFLEREYQKGEEMIKKEMTEKGIPLEYRYSKKDLCFYISLALDEYPSLAKNLQTPTCL